MQGCDLEDAGYGLHDAGCEKFPSSLLLAVWGVAMHRRNDHS
jgi:hypothetical protein